MLELQGLTRRYGAGTTTAMRIILGVLEPDAGEVRWRGQPMTHEMRKRIGYLPEDHDQTSFSNGSLPIASSRLIAVTGGGATFPHLPSLSSRRS